MCVHGLREMPSTPSERHAAALQDIAENISLARSFVGELSSDQFKADRRTVYAVIRCLEIISEASRRLPLALKIRHPEIPSDDVAGAGNIYRHHYQRVLDVLVWRTVKEHLEPLRQAIEYELGGLKE
jgi:uncharacterized protein with HEPN domain